MRKILVNSCLQMSRTVSARIPTDLHEELRERCNQIGESINDFVKASIEFALHETTDFDFGGVEQEEEEPVPEIKVTSIDDVPVKPQIIRVEP